jgi:DnaK suppressor protein
MDALQQELFRQRLLELKAELEALQAAAADDTSPVELDQARVGRLSRMDALQGQAMAQETARRRARQCAEIDAALRRIEAGDYGCCFVCGEDIDRRRLAANPTVTRCIRCAEAG